MDTAVAPGDQISVEHRSKLAAALGIAAAAVTIAWFSRALQSGALIDWLMCAALALVGVLQLAVLRDSRAPLLVADDQGVRVRHGVTWSGLEWQDIDHVEVETLPGRAEAPFRWLSGDHRVVVHPRRVDDAEVSVETFAVPLGVTTRVVNVGLTGEIVGDLDLLARGRTPVLTLSRAAAARAGNQTGRPQPPEPAHGSADAAEPEDELETATEPVTQPVVWSETETETETEPGTETETGTAHDADDRTEEPEQEQLEETEVFEPVSAMRAAAPAVRAEVLREKVRVVASSEEIPEQRTALEPPFLVARHEDVEPVGLSRARPASEPVIGPVIAAARHRARLSIDELSERTRIRPHVLESIEVDDFEPCGGDFYSRGHLRTLARIFGLDGGEMLNLFDARYAHAEIEARQVFEAELATGIGGGVRTATSGPRWSLLAAAVIALGLVWGGARVFTETPQELVSPVPDVVDTAGLTAGGKKTEAPRTTLAPLSFTAVGASPQVVVRDRNGRILWAGKLPEGQRQQVIGQAPFDVTASNGGAVKVAFLGKNRGAVGPSSAADSRNFG